MISFLVPFLFLFHLQGPQAAWISQTTHDFGDIKLSVPVKYDFRFKNTGDAPLIIDNVRSTCGCTGTDWEETPVPPGGEGTINVEYDARKPGYFYKKITVFFNGQRKGEKLHVEGFVE
jgi:hypothetical protein